MNHVNQMTEAERERLEMLIEECAEVIQAGTKALRHGYENGHPNGGPNNRHNLEQELLDLTSVYRAMLVKGEIMGHSDADLLIRWDKKLRYTYHQNGIGTVL